MALFKVKRGLAENLPTSKNDGWAYFTTDDGKFYIDYENENKQIERKALNAEQADKDSQGNKIIDTYLTIDLTDQNNGEIFENTELKTYIDNQIKIYVNEALLGGQW